MEIIREFDGMVRISLDEGDPGWLVFTFSGLVSRHITLHLPKELAEDLCMKVSDCLEQGAK